MKFLDVQNIFLKYEKLQVPYELLLVIEFERQVDDAHCTVRLTSDFWASFTSVALTYVFPIFPPFTMFENHPDSLILQQPAVTEPSAPTARPPASYESDMNYIFLSDSQTMC